MLPLRMTKFSEMCVADLNSFLMVMLHSSDSITVYCVSENMLWIIGHIIHNICICVCDVSWRGPTRMLTAGCTRAGTVGTSLMRGSPTGPAGTLCPKVSKTSSPEQHE